MAHNHKKCIEDTLLSLTVAQECDAYHSRVLYRIGHNGSVVMFRFNPIMGR